MMKLYEMGLSFLLAITILAASFHPSLATASAVVQNDSTWVDTGGQFHILGEVKNTGDVWLGQVKVTATLKDSSGGIIDVIYPWNIAPQHLPPRATASFDMVEPDTAKSAQVQSYSFTIVELQETNPLPQKLAFVNVTASRETPDSEFCVSGKLENQGDVPSEPITVYGTFYDVEGKVVYSHFVTISAQESS
jgi:hypothetical protein